MAAASPTETPSSSRHQRAWTVVSFSTVPLWLAMILLPRSALTRWLMSRLAPLYGALGTVYAAALVGGVATGSERLDFSKLESVSRGFQNPDFMLAGWTHYIAFDLFVGRWIWSTAVQEGRSARLALLLTWWAGPLGLTLFLAQRRRLDAVATM